MIWRKQKTAQAKEIASLKKRVKQLEKRKQSRNSGLKRLRKVGSASRVESSNNVSLGAQEDASKQERKIVNLDADTEVTLIDETKERYDEEMLFDIQGEAVVAEKEVTEKEVSVADLVTTAAKPKAITTAAITTTITTVVASTRPKAKGIVFHDQEEQAYAFTPIVSSLQLPHAKDKGKGKMVEHEKRLKKKDQIALDEELALRLHAEEQAELEKERVAQEEASRAEIIEEEAEMKRHIKIVKDGEVAIDAIPLASKPLMIIEYKIEKDGRMRYFKLIRADGSSKRYSSMIKMLQDIDREDLETP
ncbi:hypothetical protein Tco_0999601 [Tanacetum coccineum]